MGTIRAPLVPYMLGTAVGMAPRTGVVIWAAAHASRLDLKDSGQTWWLVATTVVTLVVVGVIGHYANEAVKRATAVKEVA
jgi:CDP-diglyceride synthetase